MKVQLEDLQYFVNIEKDIIQISLGATHKFNVKTEKHLLQYLLTEISSSHKLEEAYEKELQLYKKRMYTARDALAGGLDDGSDPTNKEPAAVHIIKDSNAD